MRRALWSFFATLVCLALLLFVPAGSWDWPVGWLYFAVFTTAGCVCAVILMRVNPDILVARSRLFREGTKRWDRVLVSFMLPAVVSIVPVAALDAGCFHWSSSLPWWVCGFGYLLFLTSFAGSTWVEAINKFAEPSVRIQTDRGQSVISTGPYAIVRRPLYTASFPLVVGTALVLDSLWALLPAAIGCLLLILRTRWEDRTLQAELPGYKEFAQRVKFKLFPGIW